MTIPKPYNSEWLVLILFTLGNIITAAEGLVSPHWALLMETIAASVYKLSRGIAKRGNAPQVTPPVATPTTPPTAPR